MVGGTSRRAVGLAALLALLGTRGCTRSGYHADDSRPRPDGPGGSEIAPRPDLDRGHDSRAAERGPDASRACSWTGNWTLEQPVALAEVNSVQLEAEPFVTEDGLTLFYALDDPKTEFLDIYFATRSSPDLPFSTPQRHDGINTSYEDSRLALSPDGLTAYLSSDRPGGPGHSDIWVARRTSLAQPLVSSLFAPLGEVSTPKWEWDPLPSRDGLRLYFMLADTAATPAVGELMMASRASTGAPFSAPQPISELNTTDYEDNPALSPDERVIVFSRAQAGTPRDLWYAVRAGLGATFSSPKPVVALNTDHTEAEAFISADGCELYFASDRPGGKGSWDLYRTRLHPLP